MAMDKRLKCLLCKIHEECGEALEGADDLVRLSDTLKRIRRRAALALLGELSGLDDDHCCQHFS